MKFSNRNLLSACAALIAVGAAFAIGKSTASETPSNEMRVAQLRSDPGEFRALVSESAQSSGAEQVEVKQVDVGGGTEQTLTVTTLGDAYQDLYVPQPRGGVGPFDDWDRGGDDPGERRSKWRGGCWMIPRDKGIEWCGYEAYLKKHDPKTAEIVRVAVLPQHCREWEIDIGVGRIKDTKCDPPSREPAKRDPPSREPAKGTNP